MEYLHINFLIINNLFSCIKVAVVLVQDKGQGMIVSLYSVQTSAEAYTKLELHVGAQSRDNDFKNPTSTTPRCILFEILIILMY